MSEISDLQSILNLILSELVKLNQVLSIRSDLDQSNQSNQIRSDQIRSDQISNNCSKNLENWKELFCQALDTYGIDYEDVALDSVESGANYYLVNQKHIASKKGYLKKVLTSATRIQASSTRKETKPKPEQKKPPEPKDTAILGIPKEVVENNRHLLTQEAYLQLIPFMDETYLKFMGDYFNVISKPLTHNIAVAMCINNGIIVV